MRHGGDAHAETRPGRGSRRHVSRRREKFFAFGYASGYGFGYGFVSGVASDEGDDEFGEVRDARVIEDDRRGNGDAGLGRDHVPELDRVEGIQTGVHQRSRLGGRLAE